MRKTCKLCKRSTSCPDPVHPGKTLRWGYCSKGKIYVATGEESMQGKVDRYCNKAPNLNYVAAICCCLTCFVVSFQAARDAPGQEAPNRRRYRRGLGDRREGERQVGNRPVMFKVARMMCIMCAEFSCVVVPYNIKSILRFMPDELSKVY